MNHRASAAETRRPRTPPVAKPFSRLRWIRTRDRSLDENLEPGINLLPRGVRGKRHAFWPSKGAV